jgi:hypothetical protein
MFKTIEELRQLCEFYLNNEDARLQKVAECNRLVRTGFSFRERAIDLLNLSGVRKVPEPQRVGEIETIYADQFLNLKGKTNRFLDQLIQWVGRHALSRRLRKKLIELLQKTL